MSKKITSLPLTQSSRKEILDRLSEMKQQDIQWKKGKSFSLVFHGDTESYELLKESYALFISENGLNPAAFPSLKKMENEVVSMTKSLLGGTEQSCGTMTSGGTESILMSIKAAREWARVHSPQIKNPEIIAPITIHPACNKACHYFGIKLVTIPVDSKTFKVDPKEIEKRISSNTIQLIASAPSYPQGAIDPIEEIGKIALKNNILFHVDACIGGIVLSFYKELGIDVPLFDISTPGVTSLSVDLHKYGYTAKGSSVILYKNRELRKHQFYCTTNWPGGIYISPSILGTRPGGAIASSWAMMNYLGVEGYKRIFQKIYETTKTFINRVQEIPGLYILGQPQASIIAIASKACDIYELADYMTEKGWHFDRNSEPASIHLTIMYNHAQVIDDFFNDLQKSFEEAKKNYTPLKNTKKKFLHSAVKVLPSRYISKIASEQTKKSVDAKGPQKMATIYGLMGTLEKKGALQDIAINLLDDIYNN